MPTWTGYFNSVGAPAIKIFIAGVFETKRTEFEATIDTGFSGFLSMPTLRAFPLGLVLYGATQLQYADGSTTVKLTALGRVSVGEELQADVIILEENSDTILAGMEFLRIFRKRLVVSPANGTVLLEDEPQAPAPAPVR